MRGDVFDALAVDVDRAAISEGGQVFLAGLGAPVAILPMVSGFLANASRSSTGWALAFAISFLPSSWSHAPRHFGLCSIIERAYDLRTSDDRAAGVAWQAGRR